MSKVMFIRFLSKWYKLNEEINSLIIQTYLLQDKCVAIMRFLPFDVYISFDMINDRSP